MASMGEGRSRVLRGAQAKLDWEVRADAFKPISNFVWARVGRVWLEARARLDWEGGA